MPNFAFTFRSGFCFSKDERIRSEIYVLLKNGDLYSLRRWSSNYRNACGHGSIFMQTGIFSKFFLVEEVVIFFVILLWSEASE